MENSNDLKSKKYNYKIIFSYDGSEFYGYAIQVDKRSVEEEIEKALSLLLNEKIKIYASGRTDKKVHALNQVANFFISKPILDLSLFLYRLNKIISKDIYFKSIKKISNNFNARFSSKAKVYEYLINNKEYDPFRRNYELFLLDFNKEKVEEIIPLFIGKHNFKNFTSKKEDEDNFIREIYQIEVKKIKNGYKLIFVGNGFMRYQIRKIVGTFIAYYKNKISKEKIIDYLTKEERDIISFQAEGRGLYLKRVKY